MALHPAAAPRLGPGALVDWDGLNFVTAGGASPPTTDIFDTDGTFDAAPTFDS